MRSEDLEREEEARAAQEYEREASKAAQEEERTRYLRAANGGESREERWNRENALSWYSTASKPGVIPNHMPQAAMTRSSAQDYAEATG